MYKNIDGASAEFRISGMTSFALRRDGKSQSAFVACREFEFCWLPENHALPRQPQIVGCIHAVAIPFFADDEQQCRIAFRYLLSLVKFLKCGNLGCDAALRISRSTAPNLVASTLVRNKWRHSIYVGCDEDSGRSRIAYIGEDVFSTVDNGLQLHSEAVVLQVVAKVVCDIVL